MNQPLQIINVFLTKRVCILTGPRGKFNLSNDQAYKVSKEIARQRVSLPLKNVELSRFDPPVSAGGACAAMSGARDADCVEK